MKKTLNILNYSSSSILLQIVKFPNKSSFSWKEEEQKYSTSSILSQVERKNLLGTITLWSRIEEEEYFLSSYFQEEEENTVDYLEESWSDMAQWAGG